jgi:hypothetical protein
VVTPPARVDSINIQSGYMLQLKDSTLIMHTDTIIVLPYGTKYRIKKSPDLRSEDFYSLLEEKSEKQWITKQLHDALITDVKNENPDTIMFEKDMQIYRKFAGWQITEISFRQVDIISGNVNDTLQVTNSNIIRTLNNFKKQTRPYVLRKNMFIKTGDFLDPHKVADNERILRKLPYLVEAKIYVQVVDSVSKKVELIVVTQDQFSIGFLPSFSNFSRFALQVYDRNFFATGNEFSYTLAYQKDTLPEFGNIISYSVDNLAGTFINGYIGYMNIPGTKAFTINLSKKFLTPGTKLGGGVIFTGKSDHWHYLSTDTSLFIPYSGRFFDVWAGYSPPFFSGESRKQVIFSGRYNYEVYNNRPVVKNDTNQQFANNQLLLGSVTFRKSNYRKSKLLVGFGRSEDVPVGQFFILTGGYLFSELASMPYFGFGLGFSRYTPIGIIGIKTDYGGFIDYGNKQISNGAISLKMIYYSPLQTINRFTFRHSLRLKWLAGLNVPSYKVINLDDNIRGLSGSRYYGQDKLAVSLESVAFTPWYLIGFRFALYAFADIGFLEFDNILVSRNHVYSSIGIGVRLRNENLVFKTIQLRFAFYNLGPEGTSKTGFDLTFTENRLFSPIEVGKPELVKFN